MKTLKIFLSLLCLLSIAPASFASDTVQSLSAWTPKGWKILQQAKGDLNGDGVADLAVVFEQHNPANIKTNSGMGLPELNTNPRTLVIFFADAGGYQKTAENKTLVPSEGNTDDVCLEDPFAGVAIRNGVLKLHFARFLSCGGWGTSDVVYTFQYDGKGLRMIGKDLSTLARNSGETTLDSSNYNTGKRKLVNDVLAEEGLVKKTRWASLPKTPPMYLEALATPEL
jgi:hypothetical protein